VIYLNKVKIMLYSANIKTIIAGTTNVATAVVVIIDRTNNEGKETGA
jgi:hypothetical protein